MTEEGTELAVVQTALDYVTNASLPLKERALPYSILRRIRIRIDRAIRPITKEIIEAMVQEEAARWGPLRITWKAQDPVYVCNLPGNWGDAGVQDQLAEWAANPAFNEFIRDIPAHLEVDPSGLAKAMYDGSDAAQHLFQLLNEQKLRIVPQRAASLSVDGN